VGIWSPIAFNELKISSVDEKTNVPKLLAGVSIHVRVNVASPGSGADFVGR
jgi:hypothetical protein